MQKENASKPIAADPPAPLSPDNLSTIAEALRPLAVPCADLIPDPANARRHPDENVDAIKGSLRVYGQRKPLVVNRRTGIIEAGNGTLEAARALGWKHVAAVYVDDDPLTATGFAIADNRTAELAEWDREALDKLLQDLKTDDPLLDRMLAELNTSICQVKPGQTDPDDIPEPPEQPRSRPGDLYILGDHRLLCGDAVNAADIDHLLDGQSIDLVQTDPPYNVKVEPRSNNAIAAGFGSFEATHHQKFDAARNPDSRKRTTTRLRPKDRPLANDFLSDQDFERLLHAWFGNMARVLLPGRSFYVWGGYANVGNYPPALQAAGLYFSQTIIWDKQHPVLTRKDFMGAHEWCFYGWREGAAHRFFGPNNATDLWSVKKISPQQMIHLTEKPVELALRAIEYSSRPGEHVLDLFGGSGSTLIAAEQTGRKAFLMEVDSLYCDVIVSRWERFTGKKAKHIPANPAR
jgi:DNA modification methylase